MQLAALDALGGYGSADIAAMVLDGWRRFTPAIRTRAIRLMLSREAWTQSYMDSIQNGHASISEIDPAGRTQLLQHRKESIRLAAKKLIASSPRGNVISEYRSVLQQHGDPSRGDVVFQRECTACHRLGGHGTVVGPELSSSASRDGDALLTNILDPNRYVPPNYMQYVATDSSGRTVSGLLSAETATSVTLTPGQGVSETLLRSNIDELMSTGQSLMPEGFEQKISKSEMADLLAFLSDSIETKPANNRPALDVGTQPGLTEP